MTFNADTLADSNSWIKPDAVDSALATGTLPVSSMAIDPIPASSMGLNTIPDSTLSLNTIPSSSVVPKEDLPASEFLIDVWTDDMPDTFLLTYETSFDNVEDNFHESEYVFTESFNAPLIFWGGHTKPGSTWQVH